MQVRLKLGAPLPKRMQLLQPKITKALDLDGKDPSEARAGSAIE